MKRALTYILAVFAFLATFSQTPADSVKVYFKVGISRFDPMLDNNARRMDAFATEVREAQEKGLLDHIEVSAFASPDGTDKANIRLASARCRNIEDYLIARCGISRDQVSTRPGGIAWEELTKLVKENPDVPDREQVLKILENTPVWIYDSRNRVVGGRKKQLMDLRGGRPYNWLLRNIFPRLRNAVAIALCLKDDVDSSDVTGDLMSEAVPVCPVDSTEATEIIIDDSMTVGKEEEHVSDLAVSFRAPRPEPYRKRFALKTNLLYYAALMPNLEFEWLINDDWSVAAEGDVAWWSDKPKNKIYQLAMISAEGRRWLLQRAPWHGLYVGLTAGIGWYDLENGWTGYRGEGAMVGPTVGYMWPISKCFSLEGGIGAGYMRTRIKEYEPRDGHHMFLRNRKLNYFGPIKLKFSIVWRFGNVYKKEDKNNSYE